MHILVDRGMVKGTLTIHMHYSWEFLKYKLTGGAEFTYIDGVQWDHHDAWIDIRSGHIIVDGPSMWVYVNGFEFAGEDDLISMDLFRPGPNRDILFLQEMDDMHSLSYFQDKKGQAKLTYEQWKAAGLDRKAEEEQDAREYLESLKRLGDPNGQ